MNLHRYRWSPAKLASKLTGFIGGQVEIGYDNLELTLEELREMNPIHRGQFSSFKLTSPKAHEVQIECLWLCKKVIEIGFRGKLQARWQMVDNENPPFKRALKYTSFYLQPDEDRLKLNYGDEAIHFYLPDDLSNLVEMNSEYIPHIRTKMATRIRNSFAVLLINQLKLKHKWNL